LQKIELGAVQRVSNVVDLEKSEKCAYSGYRSCRYSRERALQSHLIFFNFHRFRGFNFHRLPVPGGQSWTEREGAFIVWRGGPGCPRKKDIGAFFTTQTSFLKHATSAAGSQLSQRDSRLQAPA